MTMGILPAAKAPVRPGTVIKLTADELNADPKDAASTRIKSMFLEKRHQPAFSTSTGPRGDIRQNILLASLFPNIFNSVYNKQETGTMRTAGAGP